LTKTKSHIYTQQ